LNIIFSPRQKIWNGQTETEGIERSEKAIERWKVDEGNAPNNCN